MKKITAYILGILTGVILTVVVILIIGSAVQKKQQSGEPGLMPGVEMFETPGDIIQESSFRVIQSFPNGSALAASETNILFVALLWGGDSHGFYDDQIIRPGTGHHFRQIGLYRYESQRGSKTVPIVVVE